MQIEINDPSPLIALLERAQRNEPLSDAEQRLANRWIEHLTIARRRFEKLADFQAALQRKASQRLADLRLAAQIAAERKRAPDVVKSFFSTEA